MNDVVGIRTACGLHRGKIGDAADAQIDFRLAHRSQIFFLAGRKIVEDDDVLAAAHEFIDDV